MPGTPVRLLLARHGETVFNVTGRWQGQGNSPLTERGLAQARELGRALAQESIAAVYSSDLGRAVQTAREVAVPHGLDVQMEPRLREIDVGGWTGKNGDEIEAAYPGAGRPGPRRPPACGCLTAKRCSKSKREPWRSSTSACRPRRSDDRGHLTRRDRPGHPRQCHGRHRRRPVAQRTASTIARSPVWNGPPPTG